MRYADKANKINKAMINFIYSMNIDAAARQGKYYKGCLNLLVTTAVKEIGWEPVAAQQFWRRFLDEQLIFRINRERRALERVAN